MGAQDGQERGVLEPARVELGIIVVAAHVVARVGGVEQRRMRRMVLRGQILPAAGVVGPVGDARGREVEAGGNLALQRVPGGIDVGRPEDGSVALRAQVGVAREDQRAPFRLVLAEAVVERARCGRADRR